jgi:hypothetical protein
METFIRTTAGTAAASIHGNTLGIVAKDPVDGSTVQAYATFSRSELEQIRDAITEQLNRTAEPAPLHMATNVGNAGNQPYKTACGEPGNSTIYFRQVTCPACIEALRTREVREVPEGTWITTPGRAVSEFIPNE